MQIENTISPGKQFYGKNVRPILFPIGPSIAYVPLSRGLFALIDSEDADKVSMCNWSAGGPPHRIRPARSITSVKNPRRGEPYLYRHILQDFTSQDIDHINRNTLDNRKANLRPCTRQENFLNVETWRGRKRVHATKMSNGKWRAEIKGVACKRFDTLEEAQAFKISLLGKELSQFIPAGQLAPANATR